MIYYGNYEAKHIALQYIGTYNDIKYKRHMYTIPIANEDANQKPNSLQAINYIYFKPQKGTKKRDVFLNATQYRQDPHFRSG